MTWLKTKINETKEWIADNAETREDRLAFALSVLVGMLVAGLFVFIAVLIWPITVFFIGLFVVLAVLTSPVWIWILRGKK